MSVKFGSVYSVVFATLGAATERKRQKTEKKLCRTMLRPKGTKTQKAERTPNITPNNYSISSFSAFQSDGAFWS